MIYNLLTYKSSHLDWCEDNFIFSKHIAEFYNTISNLPYIFLSILGILAFQQMNTHNTDKIMYGSLCVIGITSFYFHMTLSLLGQLLDEFSIIFLLINGLILCIKDQFKKKLLISYLVTHSWIMLWYPCINIPILFFLGVVLWRVMRYRFKKYKDNSFKMYWRRAQLFFGGSIICWVGDRFFCELTSPYYLHAWWHVFSAFTGYYAILVGVFLEYNNEDHYITQNHILPIVNKINL